MTVHDSQGTWKLDTEPGAYLQTHQIKSKGYLVRFHLDWRELTLAHCHFGKKKNTHFEKRSKLNHCPLFLLLSRVSCLIIDVRFLTFGINNEELISWILVLVVLRIVNSVWRCLISK